MTLIFGLIVLALAAIVAWIFNRLVRARNQVHNAWSDVDVQLQRRHDLVPTLVATVRGYAGHESAVLERVTAERHAAQTASDMAQRGAAEQTLAQGIGRLIALGEAYPELKASDNFRQLSAQLVAIEDAIQHARRFYNGSVRDYNTDIQRFPDFLIANATGFKAAEFFAAEADARSVVDVKLDPERTP